MCDQRNAVPVSVMVPADLAFEGKATVKMKPIDACIADIVRGLSWAGIDMRGSCCGHGERPGEIPLEDGRRIEIHGGLADA